MERIIPGICPEHLWQDHIERYKWAHRVIQEKSVVVDIGCGIGYGSHLLATKCHVFAFDKIVDKAGIIGGVSFGGASMMPEAANSRFPSCDWAVCFEVIEHLMWPERFLRALSYRAGGLLLSTPNARITSPDGIVHNEFHMAEYTRGEMLVMLDDGGWDVVQDAGQRWQLAPRRRILRKAYKKLFRPWARTNPEVGRGPSWLEPEYLVFGCVSRNYQGVK